MGDAEITLLTSIGTETDENGFEVDVYEEATVWGKELSIRSNEFYEAQRSGIKLTNMFEIKPYEYEYQTKLRFEDELYNIERTYKKDTEHMELVCSRVE